MIKYLILFFGGGNLHSYLYYAYFYKGRKHSKLIKNNLNSKQISGSHKFCYENKLW